MPRKGLVSVVVCLVSGHDTEWYAGGKGVALDFTFLSGGFSCWED